MSLTTEDGRGKDPFPRETSPGGSGQDVSSFPKVGLTVTGLRQGPRRTSLTQILRSLSTPSGSTTLRVYPGSSEDVTEGRRRVPLGLRTSGDPSIPKWPSVDTAKGEES